MKQLTDMLPNIMPDVIGCPQPLVVNKILKVLKEFCDRTLTVRKTFEYTFTTADINTALNSSVTVVATPITGTAWNVQHLLRIQLDGAEKEPVRQDVPDNLGTRIADITPPGHLFWSPLATNQFLIFPLYTAAQLTLTIAMSPNDTLTEVEDDFFYRYRRILEAGARGELLMMPGMTWANPQLGARYIQEYNEGVSGAIIRTTLERPRKNKGGYI